MSSEEHPIHVATRTGNVEHVRQLLTSDSSLTHLTWEGMKQPIHLAAETNHPEIIELLLAHGADPNSRDLLNMTPLHYAAEHPDAKAAEVLVRAGANIEANDDSGEKPIHIAVQQDSATLLLLFLDHGADINSRGQFNWTPLHYAAYYARPTAAECLIGRGADLEARDANDHTALFLSLGHIPPRSSTVLGLLLQAGAFLDIHTAIRLGMTHIVRSLLNNDRNLIRVEPNAKDFLTAAIRAKKLELVEFLIAYGADLNDCKHDSLPLWAAIEGHNHNTHSPIIELLLKHGADSTLKRPPNDQSPLQWAKKNKDKTLLQLFTKYKR